MPPSSGARSMSITSRTSTPEFRDHFDQTFHHEKKPPSKYKAEWRPYSKNEEFWAEVLVGRKIVDIKFDENHLCAFKLDLGEVVHFRAGVDDGQGLIYIQD